MKNSKEYTNVWKDILWDKMSAVPKAIFRFSAIPIKIPWCVFAEIEIILKFIKEFQRTTEDSKQSWKRTKMEDSQTLISKFARKLLHNNQNTMELPWRQIYIEQWRKPEPDAQHDVYERIIFNNNTNTSQGWNTVSSTSSVWPTVYPHIKEKSWTVILHWI